MNVLSFESTLVMLFCCIWSIVRSVVGMNIYTNNPCCEIALTEGPVSASVLVGENALFHCNGSGASILWIVDGLYATDISITARGITQHIMTSSGTVQSTLTVPATLVNNGTTVQCMLYPGSMTSSTATLFILPGEIKLVANI